MWPNHPHTRYGAIPEPGEILIEQEKESATTSWRSPGMDAAPKAQGVQRSQPGAGGRGELAGLTVVARLGAHLAGGVPRVRCKSP